MCTHTHTLEHFSAIRKKEILVFATTWMDLEGIMQTEFMNSGKQRKTNATRYHLYVESRKAKLKEQRVEWLSLAAWGWER